MKTFRIGGVHPHDNKLSAGNAIEKLPLPKQAIVPLSQHIGAPAQPIVEKGERVKVGQLIAQAASFMSANVHAPISGTVTKIDTAIDAWGMPMPAIYIDAEGDGDEWLETIDRTPDINRICKLEPEQIIEKIKDAGIVGLGGACFPTHVKLMPPPGCKAEVLIVNAVECEPYLTCDHRLMLEHAEEIFIGISLLKRALKIERAIVGIENNKRDAIELFQKMADRHFGIEVCPLKLRYPQGGEKQLIDATIGRQVPSGALPISVGAVVDNVATVFAVYEAVQKNKPLIERVMTVTGNSVKHPGNYLVRFGTPLQDVIDAAGGIPDDTGKIVAGGPMMGRAMQNTDMPAHKRTSGLLMIPASESIRREPQNCMRCGQCVEACPMGLEPYLLIRLAEQKRWDEMEQNKIMDCIECGCCLYSCPSYQPLLDYVRLGKTTVGGIIRARNAKK
ncbi:MAG: electron transport complex subunit RsxC [Paludibacteraceae bacterium]